MIRWILVSSLRFAYALLICFELILTLLTANLLIAFVVLIVLRHRNTLLCKDLVPLNDRWIGWHESRLWVSSLKNAWYRQHTICRYWEMMLFTEIIEHIHLTLSYRNLSVKLNSRLCDSFWWKLNNFYAIFVDFLVNGCTSARKSGFLP